MSEAAKHILHEPEVEALLRQELVLGDQALAGVAPVLSHMLSSPGQSLVSDDIVARMRGMLGDLARPLLSLPLDDMADKVQLHIEDVRKIGQDWRFTAKPV